MTKNQTIKIRENGEKREIFCAIRKQWIVCSSEELVRQRFILHLVKIGYPEGAIGIEIGFKLSEIKPLRADIVVYDQKGAPFLLIECKAEDVKIDQEVFRQASKYNSHFKAPYIALTNLKSNYIFQTDDFITYKSVEKLPTY